MEYFMVCLVKEGDHTQVRVTRENTNDPYKVAIPLRTMVFFFRGVKENQTEDKILKEFAFFEKGDEKVKLTFTYIKDKPLYFVGMPGVVNGVMCAINTHANSIAPLDEGAIIV